MYDAFYFEFPDLCSVSYDWFLWFPILGNPVDKPLTALISVQKSSAECLSDQLYSYLLEVLLYGATFICTFKSKIICK